MRFYVLMSVLGFLECFAFNSAGLAQRPADLVRAKPPSWAINPSSSKPDPAKSLRQARSDQFNDRTGLVPRLGSDPNLTLPGRIKSNGTGLSGADVGYIPPFPVDRSSDVVVGKISSAQAFFSSDHTKIYTELTAQIERVIKTQNSTVQANGELALLEPGGALLENGKVVTYPVFPARGLVDVGQRYLLFLTSFHGTGFQVVKAWNLTSGGPRPIGNYRASNSEDVTRYTQMTQAEFLAYVENSVASGSTH